MNKVLIPTKLSDVAANTLKTAGYEVIQDADTPLEKQVAAHPDAVALIVRSEKSHSGNHGRPSFPEAGRPRRSRLRQH